MKLTKPEVLNPREMEVIHDQSLKILEEAGIRVLDADCRRLLSKAGATIETASDKVSIPRQLVKECLETAPSQFRLHGRNGTALRIGTDSRIFGSLVIDPWIIDFETQKPRRPILEDVVRHTRLGDALDHVDFLYRMDMPPDDIPGEAGYVRTLAAFATNTTKPMLAAPASPKSLYLWLEMADILAESRPLSERPFLMLSAPVTTPLTFHSVNAEILKQALRRGLPITGQTEPIAGTTAPLSFAGGIVMGNCENLFLVVMAQLFKAGTPIAYSVGNALTDFRTGHAIFYPAEKMLWKIASAQMAGFYQLPIAGEVTGSMVGRYDTQNGIEQSLHVLPPVLCGGGMFNGLGSCYNACGMSAEMIVIHSELVRLVERLGAGVEISDKTLDIASIIRNGPGGHFLEDTLTIENLRSEEFFTTGCFDRLGERTGNSFEDSLLFRAHQQVEELLISHTPAVSDRVIEDIHRWAVANSALD